MEKSTREIFCKQGGGVLGAQAREQATRTMAEPAKDADKQATDQSQSILLTITGFDTRETQREAHCSHTVWLAEQSVGVGRITLLASQRTWHTFSWHTWPVA